MKKHLFLLLIFFYQLYSFAQTFKGIVINNETSEPIGQITIVSADKTFFVTSNEKGEVVLPESMLNKKLFISDYEYAYSENTFNASKYFVWELTPNSETLEEMVIFEHPEIYLNGIIANSIKSFVSNTKLESYYRENYFENKKQASFAEGIVDFYVNNNLENVEMVVKQSRIKDFYNVNPTNRAVSSKPQDVVESSMLFSMLKKIIQDKKHYEFYITAKKVGEKTIHTFYVNPNEKSKAKHLFKGWVVFDDEKRLILETNFAFDPDRKKYNTTINKIIVKADIKDIRFESKYMVSEDIYYPSYAKRTIDAIANSKLAKIDNARINNQAYFYVLSADKTIKRPSQNIIYNSGNLYNNGNKYTVEFWKNAKVINLVE